jgi:ATP-binding cassette subfamily B protein
MNGLRAVLTFRREARNEAIFAKFNAENAEANGDGLIALAKYTPAVRLVGNLTLTAVMIVGAVQVINGSLQLGVLAAFLLYVRRMYDPLDELAMFYNSYQAAAAALEKLSGLLEERPSVPEPADPLALPQVDGRVRFEQVRFAYNPHVEVLPTFDLELPAGQTLAVVGATGAGKSTLAKLLARFYDPTSGRVLLDGVDISRLSNEDLRRGVVMVTQESFLFSGSVADNIALGKPAASRTQVEAAADAIGAGTFIRTLPEGFDTDVRKRGGRLSAGQRQLVGFARAFLADPAVLILDEATASLDIPSERAVQAALHTVLHNRTAVIIAHRLSTVAIADRVLVMDRGRIVEDGHPADLISGGGRFAGLHSSWQESLV